MSVFTIDKQKTKRKTIRRYNIRPIIYDSWYHVLHDSTSEEQFLYVTTSDNNHPPERNQPHFLCHADVGAVVAHLPHLPMNALPLFPDSKDHIATLHEPSVHYPHVSQQAP